MPKVIQASEPPDSNSGQPAESCMQFTEEELRALKLLEKEPKLDVDAPDDTELVRTNSKEDVLSSSGGFGTKTLLIETEKVEPGMLEVAPTDTAMENDTKKSAIFADQTAVLAVKSCNQVEEDILVSTNGDSITKAAFIPEVDDRVVVIESTTSSSVCCVI